MAVHAQYLSHALPHPHDHHRAIRPALDNVLTSASAFFVEPDPLAAAAAVGAHTVLSDLTWNNSSSNNDTGGNGCFSPRKRARIGDVAGGAGMAMDTQGQQRALLPPAPVPVVDAQSRSLSLCSAAASISGRPVSSQQGLLSQLYRHGVETDALIRIESERLRAGLQELRRRHVRAVERAAARRLWAAEAELERAMARNAELEERIRQTHAEGQAWQDIAWSNEGVAARLRAALENNLIIVRQTPSCSAAGAGDAAEEGGDAEDAGSCCFEQVEVGQEQGGRASKCRWCGEKEACVLLLPCRHLCLCRGCEAGVEACPVCAATRNASLRVLLQ